MTQTLISVAVFVVLLAMLPWGVRWLQRNVGSTGLTQSSTSRVVSAVAVGPHQRVVTVEVGPEGARVWLVLGVTAQTVTCLHRSPATEGAASGAATLAGKIGHETGDVDGPVA
jgi:flagellar protein FliO/FliZ